MDSLKIFFDRNVGKSIPIALRQLGLDHVYHHHISPVYCGEKPHDGYKGLFRQEEEDAVILEACGKRGWIVVSQDYRFHLEKNVREAIKAHRVGIFYLWGANARKWESFRVFAHAYDRLMYLASVTERPFIFKIAANARLHRVEIDRKPKIPKKSGA